MISILRIIALSSPLDSILVTHAARQRFKQANEYAKAAMADPDLRALYEGMAAKENGRPYAMAVSDYFKGRDLLSK